MNRVLYIIANLLFITTYSIQSQVSTLSHMQFFYNEPAFIWETSFPLGNGRIGLMPDGGIEKETYILNESSMWSGCRQRSDDTLAYRFLPKIRNLLFSGQTDKAEALMYKKFVCKGVGSNDSDAAMKPFGCYQVMGHLIIEYPDIDKQVSNYRRELNLENAIAKTVFKSRHNTFTREAFTSFNADVGVIHLTSSGNNTLKFKLLMNRPERYALKTIGNDLIMYGRLYAGDNDDTILDKDYDPTKGLQYAVRVRVLLPRGGRIVIVGDSALSVQHTSEAIILVSMATDYWGKTMDKTLESDLSNASAKEYIQLRKEHIISYRRFFERVNIDFGHEKTREFLPIEQRIEHFRLEHNDPSLLALYYQYGRYLLISSTRIGSLPPNLQGIWCNSINPPWNCDYHLNINLQMCLWPAETGNLSELIYPTLEWVERLIPSGRKTAEAFYHAKGWMVHHISNIWGFTSPGRFPTWGCTSSLGAWICSQLYTNYMYTKNVIFLKKLYPIMREAAIFYIYILVEDPNTHYLVTAPSASAENQYILPNGHVVGVDAGITMDNQAIRDLFDKTIEAAMILHSDSDLCAMIKTKRDRLMPTKISSDGRIMEWSHEYRENEVEHRHVSHLYGLYPSNEISWEHTPELAEAAYKSIMMRGGLEWTQWPGAWRSLMCSRLNKGDEAYQFIMNLITCKHPGNNYGNWFPNVENQQIDECMGGCAAIPEMLLQSQNGYIDLLPALPQDLYKNGSFRGLCVRGGGEISANWKNGKIIHMFLKAKVKQTYYLKVLPYMNKTRMTLNGKPFKVVLNRNLLKVVMNKGDLFKYE